MVHYGSKARKGLLPCVGCRARAWRTNPAWLSGCCLVRGGPTVFFEGCRLFWRQSCWLPLRVVNNHFDLAGVVPSGAGAWACGTLGGLALPRLSWLLLECSLSLAVRKGLARHVGRLGAAWVAGRGCSPEVRLGSGDSCLGAVLALSSEEEACQRKTLLLKTHILLKTLILDSCGGARPAPPKA